MKTSPSTLVTIRAMAYCDVNRVVDVHLSAFPGFFLSFLGRRFLRLFYSEALALGEIALVGDTGDDVIGFVMGSAAPRCFFRNLLRRRAFRFAVAAAPALTRQPRSALRLLRALQKPRDACRPQGTATLMSLGVVRGSQGTGAGTLLVRAFLSEAARRGAHIVDLTTDKLANDRTNVFYRNLGFVVVREIVTPEHRILNEYEFHL